MGIDAKMYVTFTDRNDCPLGDALDRMRRELADFMRVAGISFYEPDVLLLTGEIAFADGNDWNEQELLYEEGLSVNLSARIWHPKHYPDRGFFPHAYMIAEWFNVVMPKGHVWYCDDEGRGWNVLLTKAKRDDLMKKFINEWSNHLARRQR